MYYTYHCSLWVVTHFCHIHRSSPWHDYWFSSFPWTLFYFSQPHPLLPVVLTCWNPGHPPFLSPCLSDHWGEKERDWGSSSWLLVLTNACWSSHVLPCPGSLRPPALLAVGVISLELAVLLAAWAEPEELCSWWPALELSISRSTIL